MPSSSSCHQTSVLHLSTHFFAVSLNLLRSSNEQGCACCCCVVVDLPLLRVAVEGSDNPISLEKPCQASLPPDQQGHHSLGRHPEVQYIA